MTGPSRSRGGGRQGFDGALCDGFCGRCCCGRAGRSGPRSDRLCGGPPPRGGWGLRMRLSNSVVGCCDWLAQRARGGAGEGNRTLVISLEGCCSTIELHPRQESVISSQESG